MKRIKRTLLLAFLLVLYIGPSIFIVSYAVPTILTEPNMTKEFSLSSGESWYNVDWDYRKSVSLSGGGGAGTNYQIEIPVTYDSDMQADFDDIRFTDDDGITLLDYWLESYIASTSAVVWVEVKDTLSFAGLIYMYYGNSGVTTTSNGTNTFLFFDDFELNDLSRWSAPDSDTMTVQSAVKNQGTYALYGDSQTGDRFIEHNFTSPLDYSFLFHSDIRVTNVGGQYTYSCLAAESNDDDVYIGFTITNDWATWIGSPVYFEENTVVINTWFEQEVAVDFDEDELQFWLDGVAKTTRALKDATNGAVANIEEISIGVVSPIGYDLYVDEYYLRKWVNTEPVFDSFGAEEDYATYPRWYQIGSAEVRFVISIDETGLNMLLIFLGLCMIPTSAVYLVKGGKSDVSMDKLFFGIIAFMIGWALFLGGIL